MSRPYRCTCGHIELDTPGTYYCDWHGDTIVAAKEPACCGNYSPVPCHGCD